MEYSGWKICNRIKIVLDTSNKNDYPTGYIANDEKMVETATEHLREYKVIEVDNKDFYLRVVRPDIKKPSYWICIVTRGNDSFYLRIYADTLSELLTYSAFNNGVCLQDVVFGTYKGKVGVLHTGMPVYQQVLKEESMKSVRKTQKWEVGRLYYTKTKSDILLGYFPFVPYSKKYINGVLNIDIEMKQKPEKVAVIGEFKKGYDIQSVVKAAFDTSINYVKNLPSRIEGAKLYDEQQICQCVAPQIVDNYKILTQIYYGRDAFISCRSCLQPILALYYIDKAASMKIITELYNAVKNYGEEGSRGIVARIHFDNVEYKFNTWYGLLECLYNNLVLSSKV